MHDTTDRVHLPQGEPPRRSAQRHISAEPLRVSSYGRAPGAVIVLVGELDIASVPVLTDHMEELEQSEATHRAHLVADVSGLGFCDCTGLTALLRIHRQATAAGGWLRLSAATARMHKLLRVTKLSQVLQCHPGIAEAFAGVPVDVRPVTPSHDRSRATLPSGP
ncbi:anti-anti-sigma factor [Catenulispora sp. GAS73]|uniref:STAS domain-containing protein n=1 Tax=Catenulispora sp. GAS73 TaxID=3156269 RepID=UPI003513DCF9